MKKKSFIIIALFCSVLCLSNAYSASESKGDEASHLDSDDDEHPARKRDRARKRALWVKAAAGYRAIAQAPDDAAKIKIIIAQLDTLSDKTIAILTLVIDDTLLENINYEDPKTGNTLLHYFLADNPLNQDNMNHVNKEDRIFELVRDHLNILLDAGASVSKRNHAGTNALMIANRLIASPIAKNEIVTILQGRLERKKRCCFCC